MIQRKEVRDLKKGDKLSSGAVVTTEAYMSLLVPPGKMFIGIQYPGKEPKIYTWCKYTKIGVITE